MTSPSLGQRVVATPDTLVNELGEESVLLNLASGEYFGLDQTGTSMWKALTTSETIQKALDLVHDEYDAELGLLKRDMLDLIARLAASGLIEFKPSEGTRETS